MAGHYGRCLYCGGCSGVMARPLTKSFLWLGRGPGPTQRPCVSSESPQDKDGCQSWVGWQGWSSGYLHAPMTLCPVSHLNPSNPTRAYVGSEYPCTRTLGISICAHYASSRSLGSGHRPPGAPSPGWYTSHQGQSWAAHDAYISCILILFPPSIMPVGL